MSDFDFQPYRDFILLDGDKQRAWYTPTDALLPLHVGMVAQQELEKDGSKSSPERTVEQLPVLEGLRKYALGDQREHVILAGRPGSGKSTALQQLRLALAAEGLVPVLVQLKGNTGIFEAIANEFEKGDLELELKEIKRLLRNRKLILLLDGVNEMPTDELRRDLLAFREQYPKVSMIFTTRDLAVGGDLGIKQRLEMKPLTELQMRTFIGKRLPVDGEKLLGQLGNRLREIAETPLLLGMLCDVFGEIGQIPENKGELFRLFDREYDKFKVLPPVSEDFRRFKSEILQHLAFVMMAGDSSKPTEFWLTIDKGVAEREIERFLIDHNESDPASKAKEWLEDLLEHHLLQVAADVRQVEFHHQLFQEYYAAEKLVGMLHDSHRDFIDNKRFQHLYLNYLKWTEVFGLLLGLLDKENQILNIVRLGLEIDYFFGAKLIGHLKPEFQLTAIGLINVLIGQNSFPTWVEFIIWKKTSSANAVPYLLLLFRDSDCYLAQKVIEAIAELGDENNIPDILKLFKESTDPRLSSIIETAISQIKNPSLLYSTIPKSNSSGNKIFKLETSKTSLSELLGVLNDNNPEEKCYAVQNIVRFRDQNSIPYLLPLLNDVNHEVRGAVIEAITQIGDGENVSNLLLRMYDELEPYLQNMLVDAIDKLADNQHVSSLLNFLKEKPNYPSRWKIIQILKNIADDSITPNLEPFLQDECSLVRLYTEVAIGELSNDVNTDKLEIFLKDHHDWVRMEAVSAISYFGGANCVNTLIPMLRDKSEIVRSTTAWELVKIADEKSLPLLQQELKESKSTEIIRIIFAVQNRCGFYNYDVSCSPPIHSHVSQQASAMTTNTYIQDLKIFENVEKYHEFSRNSS